MRVFEVQRDSFTISTDKTRLDVALIHNFLSERAYWALGRPLDVVRRSIEHSLCFGVYSGQAQVGFARVVTDYATFAWLCDVFILETHRGQGLSKWLMETIVAHPDLASLRRFVLATRDAHGLYQRYGGFVPLQAPERWLERFKPGQTR
jgi:GNAT superfamily N-acetyltransferase